MAYTFSKWLQSEIPDESQCPFPEGSEDRRQFRLGVAAAVVDAQDSEA